MQEPKKKIAIFTDTHALLEPLQAVMDDIKKRGITEIYSLGDNIGVGPNPSEVMDLLEENNVISIAGNLEEYVRLGTAPFNYFHELKEKGHLWTLSKLNEHQKGLISLYPHSVELLIGGKNLALCHFANDVRFDYGTNSTWSYQENMRSSGIGYHQFLNTNSQRQIEQLERIINRYGKDSPVVRGCLSAMQDPLFDGYTVEKFDAIIQGHVHWKMYEQSSSTEFYSIRAVGIAYANDPVDTASYVILTEKEKGYEIEEILVKYDREKMVASVLNCDCPDKTIRKFISLDEREQSKKV